MNKPAFPTWSAKDVVQGMSLHNYFAAAALQGILATNPDFYPKQIVDAAYEYADLMMEKHNAA